MGFPLPSTDPLGTDIQLNSDGDLVVDISGSLQTVSNEENVQQAIRVQLTTVPDFYLWDDNVGSALASFVDQPITAQLEKEIITIVKEKVLEDSRILDVSEVLLDTSTPDTLIIFVSVTVSGLGNMQVPITVKGG